MINFKRYIDIFFPFLLLYIILIILSIFGAIVSLVLPKYTNQIDNIFLFTYYFLIIVLSLYYLWKQDDHLIINLKINFFVNWKLHLTLVILGIGITLFEIGLLNTISPIFEPTRIVKYNNMIAGNAHDNKIISALELLLIYPIYEELVFRGVILHKARVAFPFLIANFIQASLFAVYHMNLIQGIYTLISGMILGCIVMHYKSIYSAIVLHIYLNIFGALPKYIPIIIEYKFLTMILGGILTLIILFVFMKKDRNEIIQRES